MRLRTRASLDFVGFIPSLSRLLPSCVSTLRSPLKLAVLFARDRLVNCRPVGLLFCPCVYCDGPTWIPEGDASCTASLLLFCVIMARLYLILGVLWVFVVITFTPLLYI